MQRTCCPRSRSALWRRIPPTTASGSATAMRVSASRASSRTEPCCTTLRWATRRRTARYGTSRCNRRPRRPNGESWSHSAAARSAYTTETELPERQSHFDLRAVATRVAGEDERAAVAEQRSVEDVEGIRSGGERAVQRIEPRQSSERPVEIRERQARLDGEHGCSQRCK